MQAAQNLALLMPAASFNYTGTAFTDTFSMPRYSVSLLVFQAAGSSSIKATHAVGSGWDSRSPARQSAQGFRGARFPLQSIRPAAGSCGGSIRRNGRSICAGISRREHLLFMKGTGGADDREDGGQGVGGISSAPGYLFFKKSNRGSYDAWNFLVKVGFDFTGILTGSVWAASELPQVDGTTGHRLADSGPAR